MKINSTLDFILKTLKPFKLLIMGQISVALIWALDVSIRPYILKTMIDRIPNLNSETALKGLLGPAILYVSLSLLITVIFRFHDFFWLKLNSPLKRHIGDRLMKKMMGHSLTFFQNHFAGNLANKIKDVMGGVPDLLKISIDQFFAHFMLLAIAIGVVWTIHYKFSVLMIVWLAIFGTGSAYFVRRAKKLSTSAAEKSSNIVGQIVDILGNITSVHLFSTKDTESKKLRGHLDDYVAASQKRDWWFLGMFTFQGISFVGYQIVGFVFLINGFKDGIITAGDFALLISVNISIINSLWSLSTDIQKFSELLGNLTQGLRLALMPIDIQDSLDAGVLKITQGGIVFDNVTFHYKAAQTLFQNQSIVIDPGQKVGLVGYSGGGKSTFVNLLLRLYDVIHGRILIDGQDIHDVTQDSLRRNIAMIPQDPSLFHRTLMDNIRYGRVEAEDDEVIKAAKQAHAHEFIIKLPQGYDSLVGERGIKLSGGQRQRIAIARAILKNAPILILDEATSQLDSLTENDIQESLWKLMNNRFQASGNGGKTTIVIAHRLSTLLHMDRILVFEHGKVIEDGSHQDLLAKKGRYKTLWDAQVGGFLPDQTKAD